MSDPKPKWKRHLVVGLVFVLGVAVVAVGHALNSAKRKAESKQCSFWLLNNLGCVALVWANNHDHRMPTNYECMSFAEPVWLNEPRLWVCPSDKGNPMAAQRDWSRFRAEQASYELVSPGVADTETNAVFLRCKMHGHVLYADGSVYDGVTRRWPGMRGGACNVCPSGRTRIEVFTSFWKRGSWPPPLFFWF